MIDSDADDMTEEQLAEHCRAMANDELEFVERTITRPDGSTFKRTTWERKDSSKREQQTSRGQPPLATRETQTGNRGGRTRLSTALVSAPTSGALGSESSPISANTPTKRKR